METAATRPQLRSEKAVFDDLAELCASPGYAEAIAAFCVRDNITYHGSAGVTGESLISKFSRDRLVRTEISTLIGLLTRKQWGAAPPDAATLEFYLERTEVLLNELHDVLDSVWLRGLTQEIVKEEDFNPFAHAEALREPIFYGGEAAYTFQYRDFSVVKYGRDNDWLRTNRGFTIEAARQIVVAVEEVQVRKITAQLEEKAGDDARALLPAFMFTAQEVARQAGLPAAVVAPILSAFALPAENRNPTFQSLQDFNATNAMPLLRVGDDQFLLFQNYSLAEALYESPFFWMASDKAYSPTAMAHRGAFTEGFARDCLARVFGEARVYTNVLLPAAKGATRGEIDVLVLFGDRAIVLQAKSKRLNIEARKGNDLQLKSDFKKAVQDACDQAMDCATALLQPNCRLEGSDGKAILLPALPKHVFPICVVADHYPALAFQARQFLKHANLNGVAAPVITDIFALDVISEMLGSPLRLLNYLDLRARAGDRLLISGELTVLGYHLKRNLWLDDGYDMIVLDDDVAADLDAAMLVRREGLPGRRLPEGILTKWRGTALDRLLASIDAEPNPAALDLGLLLLQVNEDTADIINDALDRLPNVTRQDRKQHDVSLAIGEAGITFHTNYLPKSEAMGRLATHCTRRKYSERALRWFGVGLDPDTGRVQHILKIEHPWERDEALDALVEAMPAGRKFKGRMLHLSAAKPGRNDPCPCGSGLKFKKCHLNAT